MLHAFLIIVFSCLFFFLAWRNIVFATALVVAFLPSYLIRFDFGPLPVTMLEIMVLLLSVVWAIKQKGQIADVFKILKSNRWLWLVAAWLVFATISLFISPDLRAAAGVWKAYFIEPIIFLLVAMSVIKTQKNLELIFYAVGFSALCISTFAIYQKFTGFAIPNPIWQAEETRRVTSFYGYPNAVGLYLAPIVTLYIGWLTQKLQTKSCKLKETIFQFLVIIASAAAIIFARSEGAYVGILCGLFFLGIMTKKLRWPAVALASLLLIVIFAVPQFKNYAWQQISFQNDSGKVRISQWQETWKMLKDRPLSGAGLAGYQETLAPYHKAKHIEIYLYPHNLFLNFWSELGLGGLIVFLLIVIKFFKDNIKQLLVTRYWLPVALMAVMITLLVHGLVDVPYFKNDLSIFFWLLVSLSFLGAKILPEKTA
jgi:O-antigen ligase